MRYLLLSFFLLCLGFSGVGQQDAYVSIKTNYGDMVVRLYKETPVHQANFLKLAAAHYFDTTLFHRVIKNFVIQGGDPDSLFITPTDTNILKQRRIMPEYSEGLFHKRGAFGAGRDDNPLEASFYSQFYIVEGRTWTDKEMDDIERRRGNGFRISKEQREVYKTIGGLPRLDNDYTIFGEVVKGMNVVDAISDVVTLKDAPVAPVTIKVKILSRKKVKKLLLRR